MSESTQNKMANVVQEQHERWKAFLIMALGSSTKLAELNLATVKQSLDDISHSVRELLELKSPQELFSVEHTLMQERFSQFLAYTVEIREIASEFAAELGQITRI